MKSILKKAAATLLLLCGAHLSAESNEDLPKFSEARKTFATKLTRMDAEHEAAPTPPKGMFDLIKYESPAGKLDAYVGSRPKDGKKHPAIMWLVGGFSNSISEIPWAGMPADNDQSAAAFREAGLVMMYPSLRGGNQNPGHKEGLYGEVDDVLAALAYLKSLDYVDPNRIYLGGHSTGATLALLVAETSPDFRAVIAFGPIHSAVSYGEKVMPFDVTSKPDMILRAPIIWLKDISSPTFVIEGSEGNVQALRLLAKANKNPKATFHEVPGATHFTILRPAMVLIAGKLMADDGPSAHIDISDADLSKAFNRNR